jgi:hypothetical protein
MGEADGKPRRFFYGWVVVGVSGLVFAVVRGINDSFGVFLVAFVEEFGWSRAAVAGAFSFGRAVEGTVSVAIGMLAIDLAYDGWCPSVPVSWPSAS